MFIRKYTHSDRDRIIELLQLNTPEYFAAIEEDDLRAYLHNHSSNYFVIEIDDLVVGSGGFNLADDGEIAKLSWDIFHPGFQGKGLGTELTKYRIQQIREIKSVRIVSVRTSQLVYKFYERFGLVVKEIVADFWAPGFDLYRMNCDIKLVKIPLGK
ncbi:GNAT family N-acetyltransferase [Daejeonella oryzae]|uniref:GNAT family N-acetyltransferase n=1 Tax=Daejeonella oryzae TaxID=1122943 RepID=UPI00068842BB|nr:GNAT family N-acetyltransferase [Daejeonella oryzae]